MSLIRNLYKKKVSSAFNRWSEKYENEVVPKLINRGYSYQSLADMITKEFALNPEHTVLELGIGTGVLGVEVKKRVAVNLIGLDISRGMIDEASRKDIYKFMINSSAEFITCKDETFDAIYTAFMFHSVLDQDRVLSEIKRVLKFGGKVLLIDLFPISTLPFFLNSIKGFFHSINYEYGAPSNYKTTTSLLKKINKSGLHVVNHGQLGTDKNYIHYYFKIEKRSK